MLIPYLKKSYFNNDLTDKVRANRLQKSVVSNFLINLMKIEPTTNLDDNAHKRAECKFHENWINLNKNFEAFAMKKKYLY